MTTPVPSHGTQAQQTHGIDPTLAKGGKPAAEASTKGFEAVKKSAETVEKPAAHRFGKSATSSSNIRRAEKRIPATSGRRHKSIEGLQQKASEVKRKSRHPTFKLTSRQQKIYDKGPPKDHAPLPPAPSDEAPAPPKVSKSFEGLSSHQREALEAFERSGSSEMEREDPMEPEVRERKEAFGFTGEKVKPQHFEAVREQKRRKAFGHTGEKVKPGQFRNSLQPAMVKDRMQELISQAKATIDALAEGRPVPAERQLGSVGALAYGTPESYIASIKDGLEQAKTEGDTSKTKHLTKALADLLATPGMKGYIQSSEMAQDLMKDLSVANESAESANTPREEANTRVLMEAVKGRKALESLKISSEARRAQEKNLQKMIGLCQDIFLDNVDTPPVDTRLRQPLSQPAEEVASKMFFDRSAEEVAQDIIHDSRVFGAAMSPLSCIDVKGFRASSEGAVKFEFGLTTKPMVEAQLINRTAEMITRSVVISKSPEERRTIILQAVKVAKACYDEGALPAAIAIHMGVSDILVSRMAPENTWPEAALTDFNNLAKVFVLSGDHQQVRSEFAGRKGPKQIPGYIIGAFADRLGELPPNSNTPGSWDALQIIVLEPIHDTHTSSQKALEGKSQEPTEFSRVLLQTKEAGKDYLAGLTEVTRLTEDPGSFNTMRLSTLQEALKSEEEVRSEFQKISPETLAKIKPETLSKAADEVRALLEFCTKDQKAALENALKKALRS